MSLDVLKAKARAVAGILAAWAKRTVTGALRPLPLVSGLIEDAFRTREELNTKWSDPVVDRGPRRDAFGGFVGRGRRTWGGGALGRARSRAATLPRLAQIRGIWTTRSDPAYQSIRAPTIPATSTTNRTRRGTTIPRQM